MIKIVIPVCDKEIKQFAYLARWMGHLGGLEHAECLVVNTWKAQWDTPPIVRHLSTFFNRVEVFLPPLEDESGWPVSSNTMFQQTAEHLQDSPNPWFWWECDVCPLIPGWYEAMNREYEEAGFPYWGCVNQSMFMYVRDVRDTNGVMHKAGEKFLRGRHLVGAGVYPADFWKRCETVHMLPELAFDIALGPEVEPEAFDSPLYCHRWSTINYRRREDGMITMDDVDPDNNHYHGRPVPPEAVLVHGAKDLSLLALLEKESRLARP
jgi:hypothetical protein